MIIVVRDFVKKVPVFTNSYVNGKVCKVVTGYKLMNKFYVRRYFKGVIPKFAQPYCERCGIFIGESHTYKETKTIFLMEEGGHKRPFEVCPGCYDKKKLGEYECTPDIEDLLRFNIEV